MANITKTEPALRIERERSEFLLLLAQNPNHFGNLGAAQAPAAPGNQTYEEATCLGYNAKLHTLEATVQIKRAGGYAGSLCGGGSVEFVRFFIDYGGGWEDLGLTSFKVHDVPDPEDCAGRSTRPLTYLATMEFTPRRKRCGTPVLPKVRAILSWQVVPPAGNPNYPPVWGNVLDRHIQIERRAPFLVDFADLIGIEIGKKIVIPKEFETVKDLPIPIPDPPPLGIAELARMYAKPAEKAPPVEPHRFGAGDLQAALQPGMFTQQALMAKSAQWKAAGVDFSQAIGAFDKTKGNVSYEELRCLALDNGRDWLGATFEVKRSSGYSGGPCSQGSHEYVAFWADWNDTCQWEYLGTVDVRVFDFDVLPPGGLHYTALLPVSLDSLRRPCNKPKIGRVRAVLSWNSPPSATDPESVPHWGNRLDTHVLIRPGEPGEGPKIAILGGIGTQEIDTTGSGLTKPNAVFSIYGGFADPFVPSRECPFGGNITAHWAAPAAFTAAGFSYVLTRKVSGAADATEEPVKAAFPVTDNNGVTSTRTPDPVTGKVTFLPPVQNVVNLLGHYNSVADGDQLMEIRMKVYDGGGVLVATTAWYRLQLDNTFRPQDVAVTLDAGPCTDLAVGAQITGRFVARDAYFGHFSLDLLPNSIAGGINPDPSPLSISDQTALSPGSPWTFDSGSLSRCGYVVQVQAWDRSIVNSYPGSHNGGSADVGFCLR